MKRALKVLISIIVALTALSLSLLSVSQARQKPALEMQVAPAARPPNPVSGVYSLYDTLTPTDAPTATYTWIEISGNAGFSWNIGGGGPNDVSGSYPTGFVFPFYDRFYTQFRVSEKGYIFFEDPDIYVGSGAGLPGQIPNADTAAGINNFIAPFAADIIGFPGISRVYIRNDSSPRRTIIEYQNVVWCCGQYNPRTFEIILYPNGEIQLQYLKVSNFSGSLDDNQIARVGLENVDGAAGDVYTQGIFMPNDANFWADGLALRFVANLDIITAFFNPRTNVVWDDPGIDISTSAVLALGATQPVTRTFRISHSLVVSSSVAANIWEANISYPQNLGVLTSSFTVTPTFVVSVPAVVSNVNDLARVTFTAISTDALPLTATYVLTYGPAQRDLQLSKDIDPNTPPYTDGAFRYHFTADNLDANNSGRSGIARGVVITDILAPDLNIEDDNCGCVTTATLGSGTLVTMTLGNMGAFGNREIYLEMRSLIPLPSGTGSLPLGVPVSNTAYLTTSSIEVGPLSNNVATYTFNTALSPVSDLVINKSYGFDPNNVASGQAVPYRLTFYNNGNTPITNVVIIDTLPENTTFLSAVLSNNGPDLSPPGPITPTISGPMSRTLTFTIPVVDNGDWNYSTIDLWVTVPQTVPVGSTLVNSVAITDGVSGDSDSQQIIITSNYVNPVITKEPSRDINGNVIPPEPGKDYTYWIDYQNRSTTLDADNVIITDTLPPSVTLVSATTGQYLTGPVVTMQPGGTVVLPPPTGGSVIFPGNHFELVWTGIAPIPPGGGGRMAIIVHIGDDVPPGTLLVNQAIISYTDVFSPADEGDTTSVVTVETASLIQGSYKVVNKATTVAGEILQYTLAVSNAGPTQTIAFTVTDPLPAGQLSYVSHTPPAAGVVSVTGNSLLWTAAALAPGETATLNFRARVAVTAPLGLDINNTAYITGGGVNIQRSAAVEVTGGVFGNSSKTASAATVRSGSLLTYTLAASNTGSAGAVVTVTDALPSEVALVPGSFVPAGGVSVSGNSFTWTTYVSAQNSSALMFQVVITDALPDALPIVNTAVLTAAGLSELVMLEEIVTVANPDFSASTKAAGDIAVPPGSVVRYIITADNSGSGSGAATITDTLPASVTLLAGSFSPPAANVAVSGDNRSFTWTTNVNANSNRQLSFRVVVTDSALDGAIITNTAYLRDDIASAPLPMPFAFTIDSAATPDLSGSTKGAAYTGAALSGGETVTYTLVASNSGLSASPITITDILPPQVILSPGSFAGGGNPPVVNGNAFTWTAFVNAMTAESLSFQAVVGPDLADGALVVNTANLYTSSQVAPLPLVASVTISNPVYDASSKSAYPGFVSNGDTVTFSLTISNSGSVSGTVSVTDALTGVLTLVPGSFVPAGDVSVNGNGFTWSPTVDAGSASALMFEAIVSAWPNDGQAIENTAWLSSPAISNPLPLTSSVIFGKPVFDNSGKSANVANVAPGDVFTFTLTVSNTGSVTGTAAVTDTLPDTLILITDSLSVGPPAVTVFSNSFVWSPLVGAGAQNELTFRAMVGNVITDGLLIVNTAQLNHGSLTSSLPLTAAVTLQTPDLSTSEKAASASIVSRNETFTYTIAARNTAGGAARVTIIDTLPAEVDVVSGSFSPTTGIAEGSNSFTWTVDVPGNSNVALTFRVTVNEQAVDGQSITNIASLNHAGLTAPITLANQITFREPVFNNSSKALNDNTPSSGDTITYTIALSNGGSLAGQAIVRDNLPATLALDGGSFIPATGVVVNGNAFTWTLTLAALSRESLTFRAVITGSLANGVVITNVAQLSNTLTSELLTLTATLTISNTDTGGVIYLPIVLK